jgi:hypothetical protein
MARGLDVVLLAVGFAYPFLVYFGSGLKAYPRLLSLALGAA